MLYYYFLVLLRDSSGLLRLVNTFEGMLKGKL